jgi:hypothetical protein
MRALPSPFDATPTIGGPLFVRLLLRPLPKPLPADSKSTGADSDTFNMVIELLKFECGDLTANYKLMPIFFYQVLTSCLILRSLVCGLSYVY